jgi:hypothetical protein
MKQLSEKLDQVLQDNESMQASMADMLKHILAMKGVANVLVNLGPQSASLVSCFKESATLGQAKGQKPPLMDLLTTWSSPPSEKIKDLVHTTLWCQNGYFWCEIRSDLHENLFSHHLNCFHT